MENTIKERFISFAKEHGYANLHQVSKATGIESGNLYSNLTGKFDPSIKRLFLIANTMRVPIDDVINIFYEKEMKTNQSLVNAEENDDYKENL